MNYSINKIIVTIFFSLIILVILFIKWLQYFPQKSTTYSGYCFDCVEFNYTKLIKINAPNLFLLNNENISNIKISYDRFLSKKGKLNISYNYKLKNKKEIRKYGISYNIEPKDINWKIFNTLTIKFINNDVFLIANKDFLETNQKVFIENLNEALNESIKRK